MLDISILEFVFLYINSNIIIIIIINTTFFFKWVMFRKGDGGLYKPPTQEERGKRAAKRIER